MGTSSRLATWLDADMLDRHGVKITSAGTPDHQLHRKSGAQVAWELGGRYLIRYLRDDQLPRWQSLVRSSVVIPGDFYVTPTPLSPEEAVSWLALPRVNLPPRFAVFIKPEKISSQTDGGPALWGPRWVRLGGGIEYIIRGGIPVDAIVDVGVSVGTKWPLLVT